MRKFVLLDEIHVSLSVRKTLPKPTVNAAARTLRSRPFQTKVRTVLNRLVARHRALRELRVTISR